MRFPARPGTVVISCAVMALLGFILTDIIKPKSAWLTVAIAVAMVMIVMHVAGTVERRIGR